MTFTLGNTKSRVYELFIGDTSVGLMDDIEASVTLNLKDRTCQQFHQQVMGHRILGVLATVKGVLREITRANLLAALPWAGSTTSESLSPATMGGDLYDTAKAVRLHPMDLAATDYTEDINLLKCGRVGGLALDMDGSAESGIPYEVVAYPDRSELPDLILGYLGPVPAAGT